MATATLASALTCRTTSSRSPSTITRAAVISAQCGAQAGAAVSRVLSSASTSVPGVAGAMSSARATPPVPSNIAKPNNAGSAAAAALRGIPGRRGVLP